MGAEGQAPLGFATLSELVYVGTIKDTKHNETGVRFGSNGTSSFRRLQDASHQHELKVVDHVGGIALAY
jgi:hypothetical protein